MRVKLKNYKIENSMKIVNCKLKIIILVVFALLTILVIPRYAEAGLMVNRTLYLGLTNDLVGHWTFDGPHMGGAGTTATDISGQGNHGTLTNGPVRAAGKLGQALEFDGGNDYVSVGSP